MTTIFATGLFADRHQHFIRKLCQEFEVLTFKGGGLEVLQDISYQYAEDCLEASAQNISLENYVWEMHQGLSFVEKQLEEIFPNDPKSTLTTAEFLKFHQMSFSVIRDTRVFRNLLQVTKIDMVVTCADYDSTKRRNVVMVARENGIATLNIDHGSHFPYMPRELFKENMWRTLRNAAEYVNVDNVLEEEALKGYFDAERPGAKSSFIVCGTPMDQSYDPSLSRESASEELKLDPDTFHLTLMGTWDGGSNLSSMVQSQVDYVEFLDNFLEAFATFPRKDELQIIFKLHPAHGRPDVFFDVKRAWENKVKKIGGKSPIVIADRLTEVVSASDLIVSPGFTSVQWDTFLADVPSLVLPLDSYVAKIKDPEMMKQANEMYQKKLLRVVLNQEELWQEVDFFMCQDNLQQYKKDIKSFKEEKSIEMESPAIKVDRLCDWIKNKCQG